jgi:hypothetical protein
MTAAINPDQIDALVARLMTVIDSDPASSLEAIVALLTVVGANAQRGSVSHRELFDATVAYDLACGGILRRQNMLSSAPGRRAIESPLVRVSADERAPSPK